MNYFLGSYIFQKKLELLIKECCEKTRFALLPARHSSGFGTLDAEEAYTVVSAHTL